MTRYKYDVDEATVYENVERAYERTRECVHCARQDADSWYFIKGAWIREQARKYNLDVGKAFDIYSLLSMNTSVPENDRLFLRYLRKQRVGHFDTVKQRITWVRRGDERAMQFKNAAKVRTFSPTLRYPHRWDDVAVIDRWSARVGLGTVYDEDTKDAAALAILGRANLTGYRLFEQAYVNVARKYGVRPHQVQAPTWVHEQEQHERRR